MKKILIIIFIFGLSHFGNNANAQTDLLDALAYALKHPEQFQAISSDDRFKYEAKDGQLFVYQVDKSKKTSPIQILTAEEGYDLTQPFALTLNQTEDRLLILSNVDTKIISFWRDKETGLLKFEEAKHF